MLIDDRLWRIRADEVAALNSSAVSDLSEQAWNSYERGADLLGPPR